MRPPHRHARAFARVSTTIAFYLGGHDYLTVFNFTRDSELRSPNIEVFLELAMPHTETVVSVLISSPSDVSGERLQIEKIIRELNVTWSAELGIRLDPIMWESHATPGFGEDAQDVVNKNLPNDYDLFIGIMWHRFGTPTKRAGSGTEEEFNKAHDRYFANDGVPDVMFYFSNSSPTNIEDIDPDNLKLVREFKEKIRTKGLYWEYKSIEEFSDIVRVHLSRKIQNFKKQINANLNEISGESALGEPVNQITVVSDNLDECGFLDALEMSEAHFGQIETVLEDIGAGMQSLNEVVNNTSMRINDIVSSNNASENRSELKKLIISCAHAMDALSKKIEDQYPVFDKNFKEGIKYIIHNISFIDETDQSSRSTLIEKNINDLGNLHNIIMEAYRSNEDFGNAVAELPRMTKETNIAKKRLVSAVNELNARFSSAYRLVGETIDAYRAL